MDTIKPAPKPTERVLGQQTFRSPFLDASEEDLSREAAELQTCLRAVDVARDLIQEQGDIPTIFLHNRVEETMKAVSLRIEASSSSLVCFVAVRAKQLLGAATLTWLSARTSGPQAGAHARGPSPPHSLVPVCSGYLEEDFPFTWVNGPVYSRAPPIFGRSNPLSYFLLQGYWFPLVYCSNDSRSDLPGAGAGAVLSGGREETG